jgi:membrane protease YdiL (CAAX protease family)
VDWTLWLGNLSEWLGVAAVIMIAGVSPMLKKIRRVEFQFPERDANFAFTLFVLIYVFAFEYYSNSIFNFFKVAAASFAGGEIALQMILAVVCLIPFIIALIVRGQPLKSIGWGRENLRAGLTVGLMLAVLTIFLRGKFMTMLAGVSPAKLAILLVVLLYSLAEETIFRGYIQLRLDSRLGQKWGWLASTALYVIWQLPGRLGVLPFTQLWPILLVALIQGLLLGWIMKKSGHVLAPALYRAFSLWIMLV